MKLPLNQVIVNQFVDCPVEYQRLKSLLASGIQSYDPKGMLVLRNGYKLILSRPIGRPKVSLTIRGRTYVPLNF